VTTVNRALRDHLTSGDAGARRDAAEAIRDFIAVRAREERVAASGVIVWPDLDSGTDLLVTVSGVPVYASDLDQGDDVRSVLVERLLAQPRSEV
jgi:hypothetical protein